MKYKSNTKEKGTFYFLVTKEGNDFVGVCLNLNISEYGKDPSVLMQSIGEAAIGILESVRKKNLSDKNLNVLAPQKYWKIADKFNFGKVLTQNLKIEKRKKVDSVYFNVLQQPYSRISSIYLH